MFSMFNRSVSAGTTPISMPNNSPLAADEKEEKTVIAEAKIDSNPNPPSFDTAATLHEEGFTQQLAALQKQSNDARHVIARLQKERSYLMQFNGMVANSENLLKKFKKAIPTYINEEVRLHKAKKIAALMDFGNPASIDEAKEDQEITSEDKVKEDKIKKEKLKIKAKVVFALTKYLPENYLETVAKNDDEAILCAKYEKALMDALEESRNVRAIRHSNIEKLKLAKAYYRNILIHCVMSNLINCELTSNNKKEKLSLDKFTELKGNLVLQLTKILEAKDADILATFADELNNFHREGRLTGETALHCAKLFNVLFDKYDSYDVFSEAIAAVYRETQPTLIDQSLNTTHNASVKAYESSLTVVRKLWGSKSDINIATTAATAYIPFTYFMPSNSIVIDNAEVNAEENSVSSMQADNFPNLKAGKDKEDYQREYNEYQEQIKAIDTKEEERKTREQAARESNNGVDPAIAALATRFFGFIKDDQAKEILLTEAKTLCGIGKEQGEAILELVAIHKNVFSYDKKTEAAAAKVNTFFEMLVFLKRIYLKCDPTNINSDQQKSALEDFIFTTLLVKLELHNNIKYPNLFQFISQAAYLEGCTETYINQRLQQIPAEITNQEALLKDSIDVPLIAIFRLQFLQAARKYIIEANKGYLWSLHHGQEGEQAVLKSIKFLFDNNKIKTFADVAVYIQPLFEKLEKENLTLLKRLNFLNLFKLNDSGLHSQSFATRLMQIVFNAGKDTADECKGLFYMLQPDFIFRFSKSVAYRNICHILNKFPQQATDEALCEFLDKEVPAVELHGDCAVRQHKDVENRYVIGARRNLCALTRHNLTGIAKAIDDTKLVVYPEAAPDLEDVRVDNLLNGIFPSRKPSGLFNDDDYKQMSDGTSPPSTSLLTTHAIVGNRKSRHCKPPTNTDSSHSVQNGRKFRRSGAVN